MAEVTVKGFIIARLLDMVRDTLSEEEFRALEQELGLEYRSLKLAYFRDYPVSLQLAVEERVAEILWGKVEDESFYRFGRMNFETFRESAIGRTTLALVGKEPRRIIKASIRLMSTVMSGMVIEVEDRGTDEIAFRFRNNPYRPLGWKGVIDAVLESVDVEPVVKIIEHGPGDTEYLVSWR